jgi:hypothetical protein
VGFTFNADLDSIYITARQARSEAVTSEDNGDVLDDAMIRITPKRIFGSSWSPTLETCRR